MIISKINKPIIRLLHCNINHLITQKFYYGQGGELQLDLTKRSYDINIQTIWEDHSLLEIEGLTGVNNFTLYQDQGVSYFKDCQLDTKQENIKVTLKVPEDYTLRGRINGSLNHIASSVGRQMRSKPFQLQALGDNRHFSLGDVRSQSVNITNTNGHINIPSLTIQEAKITCDKFESKKLMTSSFIELTSRYAYLRSLIMFGKSIGKINCANLSIQSISGPSKISSQQIKIERYYGGQGSIDIRCKSVKDKLRIETGTGRVQFQTQEQALEHVNKIELGKMHKGKIEINKNIVLIS